MARMHNRRTRVRTHPTEGTASAVASMLQKLCSKRSDECCDKSRRRSRERGASTPGSLASSAITARTSVSHLESSTRLSGLDGALPSRRSTIVPSREENPTPREEDQTSSGPPKRRRSSLVGQHIGLGGIRYHFVARSHADLREARAEASLRRRPVIIVAQDPPSSSSEQANDAFSHPLVAEAIECLFVAVATSDPACVGSPSEGEGPSRGGKRRPENTAVRIVWGKSEGGERDVRVPFDGLSVGTVTTAMVDALTELGGGGDNGDGDGSPVIPQYMRLLAEEEGGGAAQKRTALFGSPCSRRAEAALSRLDGIVATRAGRVDSRHVASVVYDAGLVSYGELVRFALLHISADAVFYRTADERIGAQIELQRARCPTAKLLPFPETVRRDEVSSKAALRSTCLCCVPLTDLQSTRANRLVDAGRFHEAVRLLSPRQGRMLMKSVQSKSRHDKFREAIDVPIRDAWKRVEESGAMDED